MVALQSRRLTALQSTTDHLSRHCTVLQRSPGAELLIGTGVHSLKKQPTSAAHAPYPCISSASERVTPPNSPRRLTTRPSTHCAYCISVSFTNANSTTLPPPSDPNHRTAENHVRTLATNVCTPSSLVISHHVLTSLVSLPDFHTGFMSSLMISVTVSRRSLYTPVAAAPPLPPPRAPAAAAAVGPPPPPPWL